MTEKQIQLLRRALDLYNYTIEQRRGTDNDSFESSDFYFMCLKLEELLGVDDLTSF